MAKLEASLGVKEGPWSVLKKNICRHSIIGQWKKQEKRNPEEDEEEGLPCSGEADEEGGLLCSSAGAAGRLDGRRTRGVRLRRRVRSRRVRALHLLPAGAALVLRQGAMQARVAGGPAARRRSPSAAGGVRRYRGFVVVLGCWVGRDHAMQRQPYRAEMITLVRIWSFFLLCYYSPPHGSGTCQCMVRFCIFLLSAALDSALVMTFSSGFWWVNHFLFFFGRC